MHLIDPNIVPTGYVCTTLNTKSFILVRNHLYQYQQIPKTGKRQKSPKLYKDIFYGTNFYETFMPKSRQ